MNDLKKMYKTVMKDPFPSKMKIVLEGEAYDATTGKMTEVEPMEMTLEKKTWVVEGEETGLRYGENPGQPAALYKPVENNISFKDVNLVQAGEGLTSDAQLLQSGKHPGKTNITDVDNALNILRYFDEAAVSIMKHNNPCGVALDDILEQAYQKANKADRIAAFGGAIVLNRPVDKATAEAIVQNYSEVVAAPGFEEGVMDVFGKRKNLRVMEIPGMKDLKAYSNLRCLEFKSLIDGSQIVQFSYSPNAKTLDDFRKLPVGYAEKDGKGYKIQRLPTDKELKDMRFGWLVESGVTSNSVIYVKDGVTVGIGTGEQDRVGVAEIARDKAYRKLADRMCFEQTGKGYNELLELARANNGSAWERLKSFENYAESYALQDAVMVSDAFFPNPDGVLVGLKSGVRAILQPGGSLADVDVIKTCNDYNATMVYTEQRSFKH